MKTPLLKRHLNPFLLVSTVLILSLLAGLSVLYQGQLDTMVSERQQLSQELQDKNQRIAQLKQEKSNLSTSLGDTESDLERYIDLYKTEKNKRETLENDVSELETQIEDLKKFKQLSEDLKQSLGDICDLEYENMTSDFSKQECEDWGHR